LQISCLPCKVLNVSSNISISIFILRNFNFFDTTTMNNKHSLTKWLGAHLLILSVLLSLTIAFPLEGCFEGNDKNEQSEHISDTAYYEALPGTDLKLDELNAMKREKKLLDRVFISNNDNHGKYSVVFYKQARQLKARAKSITYEGEKEYTDLDVNIAVNQTLKKRMEQLLKLDANVNGLKIVFPTNDKQGYVYIGNILGAGNSEDEAKDIDEVENETTAQFTENKRGRENDRRDGISPNPQVTKRNKAEASYKPNRRSLLPRNLDFDDAQVDETVLEKFNWSLEKLNEIANAANSNNIDAQYALGSYYQALFYKNLIDRQLADQTILNLAIKWYKKAADSDHLNAQQKLIDLQQNGYYTNINEKAIEYYEQAIKNAEKNWDEFINSANETSGPLNLSDLVVMPLNANNNIPISKKGPLKITWGGPLWNIDNKNSKLYSPLFVPAKTKNYEDGVMAIDPSGDGADETAYCVVKRIGDYYFILALGGLGGDYNSTKKDGKGKQRETDQQDEKKANKQSTLGNTPAIIEQLVSVALVHRVNYIYIEKNNDNSFANLLEQSLANQGAEIKVVKFLQSKNKPKKIIKGMVGPLLKTHHLVIDSNVLKNDFLSEPQKNLDFKFFYQLITIRGSRNKGTDTTGLPNPTHDDRLDVVANALAFLMDRTKNQHKTVENLNILMNEALKGDLKSQFKLAEKYKQGLGIEQDDVEALKWYEKALATYEKELPVKLLSEKKISFENQKNILSQQQTQEREILKKIWFNLAELYRKGVGIVPDYTKAFDFYGKLCEVKNARGCCGLAAMYQKNLVQDTTNSQTAFLLYTQAAEKRYKKAQYELAKMYEEGTAIIPTAAYHDRLKIAFNLYLEAAKQQHWSARLKVAEMYYKGLGTEQNYKEAFHWYLPLAIQGEPKAELRIAKMYQKGLGGLKIDYKEAVKWYQKATRNKNPATQYALAKLYQNGWKWLKDIDEGKALEIYLEAAKRGFFKAEFEIGKECQKKEKDAEAINWYEKVIHNPDLNRNNNEDIFVEANYNLGLLMQKSNDFNRAIYYYIIAAQAGHKAANTALGHIYFNGLGGTAIDKEKALEYYSKG